MAALSSSFREVKTEAVSSTGPTVTSPPQARGIETGAGAPYMEAQTLTKTSAAGVTGTGSVTATPTAYTTAVATMASSTTVASGEMSSSLLGKRIRRQSTKYEDYEQQSLVPVCLLNMYVVCVCRCCT